MEKQNIDEIISKIDKDYNEFRSSRIRTSDEVCEWIKKEVTLILSELPTDEVDELKKQNHRYNYLLKQR